MDFFCPKDHIVFFYTIVKGLIINILTIVQVDKVVYFYDRLKVAFFKCQVKSCIFFSCFFFKTLSAINDRLI